MLDALGKIIYVGKAKNLKNRVNSYFTGKKDLKTTALVAQIHDLQITVTASEVEALLLENSLINQLRPKFNIIFKDDKSYPYLLLTTEEKFPYLKFYRGSNKVAGELFGPFPSSSSVKDSLELLQSIFKLRQCDAVYFRNRTRPCLQYQIGRCSAPCVGLIKADAYAKDLQHAKLFLQGKTSLILDALITDMEAAAKSLNYELAAKLRDQIIILKNIQKKQVIVDPNSSFDLDILGIARIDNYACVHLLCIREGRMLGSRQYYPKQPVDLVAHELEICKNFIMQHYLKISASLPLPEEILLSTLPDDYLIIEAAIKQIVGKKIKLIAARSADSLSWVKMANLSAKEALISRVSDKMSNKIRLQALESALQITINKIECFDVSHTSGAATIASCVVYTGSEMARQDYRLYTINTAAASDDYAAMFEALTRHFTKSLAENIPLPELLIIDGGKGQLHKAELVQQALNLSNIKIISMAKGKARKPGLETIYLNSQGDTVQLKADGSAMHLLQTIRDEAHRFAITGHRNKRAKIQLQSKLELITGIGKIKRQQLLNHFGGMQGLQAASVEEISNIAGFSSTLAARIYHALHKV